MIKKILSFIKKYYIIGIILFFATVLLMKQCKINDLKREDQLKAIKISALVDSVKTVISKNGELTFKINSVTIDRDNAKKGLELAGFEIRDYKDREINWRKTELAYKAVISAYGNGHIDLKDTVFITNTNNVTDTISGLTANWNDGFLFLKPIIQNKKLDFKYNYLTGIGFNVSKEGNSSIVSAYLTDPNDPKKQNSSAKIISANSVTVSPSKSWWGWKYIEFAGGLGLGYLIFK